MRSGSRIYGNKKELHWKELFPKDFCTLSFIVSGKKRWEGILNKKYISISKLQLSTSEIWKQTKKKDTWKSLSQRKRNLHMGIVFLMLNRTGFVNEVLRIASLFDWNSVTFYPEQLGCSSKVCSKSHGGFHSYNLLFSHCPMQNSRNAACLLDKGVHWMNL